MNNILLEDYINHIYSLAEEEDNPEIPAVSTEPGENTPGELLTMTPEQLRYVLKNSKGKIMTVVYKKKNGELRTINLRTGVKQNITGKGMNYDPDTHGYVIVWDMQKKNYRTLNPDTATILKGMGKTYTIKEGAVMKPVTFTQGPIRLQGEQAWRRWKALMDINRRDTFVYGVLTTIGQQNYLATEKQQSILNKWYNT